MPNLPGRILLLSVGTGDLQRREETLFAPLQKSIKDGEFARVILLPSTITEQSANALKERSDGINIEVSPLPKAGQENNADACFEHFNAVISSLIAEGTEPQCLVVDFTRGTKAMSAALVLAAVRHEIPRLRYITGDRDQRGMVIPGTEQIQRISPVLATGQRQLDFAKRFFREGNFAGALAALPEIDNRLVGVWPETLVNVIQTVRPWAEFYAAWDRLDYRAANQIVQKMDVSSEDEWIHFAPNPTMLDWVRELASEPSTFDHADYFSLRALGTRRITIDLFANGLRRMRHQQYEDAFIRAYRVLELVGQIALFNRGFDSADIPPDNPTVNDFIQIRKKKGKTAFSQDRNGKLMAAREQVAIFLKHLDDPLGKILLKLGSDQDLPIRKRNVSILIHGFKAEASSDEALLQKMYNELEKVLVESNPESKVWLATARQLEF